MNLKRLLIRQTFSSFNWPQIICLLPIKNRWVSWVTLLTFLAFTCTMPASIGFTCQFTSWTNCQYSPSKLSMTIDEVSTSDSKIFLLHAWGIQEYVNRCQLRNRKVHWTYTRYILRDGIRSSIEISKRKERKKSHLKQMRSFKLARKDRELMKIKTMKMK